MKFELDFAQVDPHPVDKVWRALTDPVALGDWLMETDFVPQPGRAFTMWCDNGAGGTDVYRCRLLDYEPPRRMRWSWLLDGNEDQGETFVEFRLAAVAGGTRVTIIHTGDRDGDTIDKFKGGWPLKLEQLALVLSGNA